MEKPKEKRVVGLIGCGAIGSLLAKAMEQEIVKCDKLVLYDLQTDKANLLRNSLHFPTVVVSGVDEMLEYQPVVVVEAASQQAVKSYVPRIVTADVEVIVMSTGALLDLDLQSKRIHVPAGAIGGLDALSSAALTRIDEVLLTSRKNPKALEMNNKKPELIYEGYANEAAKRFPRAMNVAATLALAVQPAKVKVQVISDPRVQRNTHEIHVQWEFGHMVLRFENDPHPENLHTSALAAWSALQLLKSLLET